MSHLGFFCIRTWIFAMWFCVSYLHVPLAFCRSVGDFKVQHNLGTPGTSDLSTFSTGPTIAAYASRIPQRVPQALRQRWLHSPVRSRNLVTTRGRKMLFGTRGGCASEDLTLIQGPLSTTGGIPTFSVQIINLCGDCALRNIHVACGDWASATPVDPNIFTRLSYNNCLVNNGQPISSQGSITFQYSNSAMYQMSISSASNDCNP